MRRLHGPEEARRFFSRRFAAAQKLPQAASAHAKTVFGEDLDAEQFAARVIAAVRREGDAAVRGISSILDGERLDEFEVPKAALDRALHDVGAEVRTALEAAAARVRAFQEAAKPKSWRDPARGYGEIVTPIRRVGVYVPGGVAPLASTAIMTVVPARVAGVEQVVLTSPAPGERLPHPAVLAAARIAGVDRVFKLGGAQAIAALGIGTASVPKVDLVCGPGSVFTTMAKKLLYGEVGVDGLYGPTETLVIADDAADVQYCAADLLAQAEHDVMAMPVLVTTSSALADKVDVELERRLAVLPRGAIATASVRDNGASVIVGSLEEAFAVANEIAPEHMCVMVREPARYRHLVRSAGGLFLGEYSAEVMGDYIAGPSHVMPTGGTARFASAVSVRTFLRITPVLEMTDKTFLETGREAERLARAEGLEGHARAAGIRLRRLLGE